MKDKTAVLAQWAQMIAGSASVEPLPLRLCLACVRLTEADGGAITLAYTRTERALPPSAPSVTVRPRATAQKLAAAWASWASKLTPNTVLDTS